MPASETVPVTTFTCTGCLVKKSVRTEPGMRRPMGFERGTRFNLQTASTVEEAGSGVRPAIYGDLCDGCTQQVFDLFEALRKSAQTSTRPPKDPL